MEINDFLLRSLIKKARRSSSTFKVSAIALDKKGDVLGCTTNSHSKWDVLRKYGGVGRAGTGIHAERRLIQRYGSNIKTIIICRVGHGGDLRPINPCHACKKVADKFGIKILSINN